MSVVEEELKDVNSTLGDAAQGSHNGDDGAMNTDINGDDVASVNKGADSGVASVVVKEDGPAADALAVDERAWKQQWHREFAADPAVGSAGAGNGDGNGNGNGDGNGNRGCCSAFPVRVVRVCERGLMAVHRKLTPATLQPLPRWRDSPPLLDERVWRVLRRGGLPLRGRARVFWLGVYLTLCVVVLSVMYWASLYNASVPGFATVWSYSCRIWMWGDDWGCGDGGMNCGPLNTTVWSAFRCHQRCGWGDGLPIYGTDVYKAQSGVCRAAIHAGVVGPNGGCALLRTTGARTSFPASERNGIQSEAYDSWFPKSYTFAAAEGASFCTDLGWWILATNLAMLLLLPLLQPPTWLYWCALLSSAYFYFPLEGDTSSVEDSLGSFLPFLAVAFVMYRFFYGRDVTPSPARYPIDVFLFYTLPCYLGGHVNYMTYLGVDVSIDAELFSHGAGVTAVIVAVMVVLVALLAYYGRLMYRTGRLPRVLLGYAVFLFWVGVVTGLSSADYAVHLHHYQFGLLFLPILCYEHRLSAFLQALLIGLFVNGVTVWGFASLWVARGGGGSPRPPDNVHVAVNATDSEVTLAWNSTGDPSTVYGVGMNNVQLIQSLDIVNYTVTGLISNLTYEFCVTTMGFMGSGGSCDRLEVRTLVRNESLFAVP